MAKITISNECIGCGACTSVSDNFELVDNKAKPNKENVDGDDLKKAKEAADICPVNAIKIENVLRLWGPHRPDGAACVLTLAGESFPLFRASRQ